MELEDLARDVRVDPEVGLRHIDGEAIVPDPGQLAVRHLWSGDSEPPVPDLVDPEHPNRAEVGAVADPGDDPSSGRSVQGDPLPGPDGGDRRGSESTS